MLFKPSRMHAAALAVMLMFSVQAQAANDDVKPVETKNVQEIVKKKSRYTDEEREAERKRRVGIVERSNHVFTLLGGEMALQKRQAGTALATYMLMLNRTQDSEVAERALEMAVSLNAFEQAERIYQKWREIEPTPSAAQKRMAWVYQLVRGGEDASLSGLDDVLAHADTEQTRRIFLLLARTAVLQPDLAEKTAEEVRKAAKRYPDMSEAAIADVIFSTQNNSQHAVEALQRLAALDADILPPTEMTLRLLVSSKPEVLSRFFKETDTSHLSPIWQELEIETLIADKQYDQAYSRLQQRLSADPNADLYIQAAALAGQRKEPLNVVGSWLEKAYQIGTSEQQSRAAVIGAMRYANDKDYAQAKMWVNRINDKSYVFDKAVLQASLAAESGDNAQALAIVRKAQKLPEQEGRYFGSSDLQRLYIHALSQQNRPQDALVELNALAAKTMKQAERSGNYERAAETLYQRALVYEKLGRYDRAIADLRQYVAWQPNSAAGMNALGYTMLTAPGAHNIDEAFRLIQAAYHLEPESAAINDSMGWAYYKKGDAQAALPYLQYALEQYPDAEVAAHLGEVLWQLGEQEKAKTIWQQGLNMGGDMAVLRKTMQRFGVAAPKAAAKPVKSK